jgi:hypothetical protein
MIILHNAAAILKPFVYEKSHVSRSLTQMLRIVLMGNAAQSGTELATRTKAKRWQETLSLGNIIDLGKSVHVRKY